MVRLAILLIAVLDFIALIAFAVMHFIMKLDILISLTPFIAVAVLCGPILIGAKLMDGR